MSWDLVLEIMALMFTFIISFSAFLYLIIKLVTNPIINDIKEVKAELKSISKNVKRESDLFNLIQVAIDQHEKNCPYNKIK